MSVDPVSDLSATEKRALLSRLLERKRRFGPGVPLSFAQQRLWYLDQLDPRSAVYNVGVALRVRGPLRPEVVERTVNEIVRRHEILRTRYVEGRDGPLQVVLEELEIGVPVIDLRGLPEDQRDQEALRRASAEWHHPFDLHAGRVLRAVLLQLRDDEYVQLLVAHHIALDGWSAGILNREFLQIAEAYQRDAESPLSPLPLQYADFALAHRRWLEAGELERQLAYWTRKFSPRAPDLSMPLDRPRPRRRTGEGGVVRSWLAEDVADGLRRLGRSQGATLFMTLLALLELLLHQRTGQTDFVVGTDAANRTWADSEDLVGFFVNQLALRADVSGDPSFDVLLGRVRDTCLEAYGHQNLPFDQLVRALCEGRDPSRPPLFAVKLVVQPGPPAEMRSGDLVITPIQLDAQTARLDLQVDVYEVEEGLRFAYRYATDVLLPESVEGLARDLERLAVEASAASESPVSEIVRRAIAPGNPGAAPTPPPPGRVAAERTVGRAYRAPRNEVEATLCEVWSGVLGQDRIGVHDNFFELGGDSLLSLQVVQRAREAGLHLTPRQLLERQTVAKLAEVSGASSEIEAEQGPVTGPAVMLPIQCQLLEEQECEPAHWNLSVLVEVPEELDAGVLEQAIQALVVHHDALRMRYERREGRWLQRCAGLDARAAFTRHDLSGLSRELQDDRVLDIGTELQGRLDLSAGPLIRVGLFRLGDQRRDQLLFTAHHLLVDVHSMRIVMEDLLTAYEQLSAGLPVALPPKTSSFRRWGELMQSHARSDEVRGDLDYWLLEGARELARIPLDFEADPQGNRESSSAVLVRVLSEERTAALLHVASRDRDLGVADFLLTALMLAFRPWTGAPSLRVELWGHGREDLFEGVDLSRTVGWFATRYPVTLAIPEGGGPTRALFEVRDQLRRVPSRGLSFGLLRYLCDAAEARPLAEMPGCDVLFDYVGRLDQTRTLLPTVLNPVTAPDRCRSPRAHRGAPIEVYTVIGGGRLALEWRYSRDVHQPETIESLANAYLDRLCELIEGGNACPGAL